MHRARSEPSGGSLDQVRGRVEVIGDATNPEDLRRAGIDRADALIAACDADSENLVVVLTARSTKPDLRIVSRVNEAAWLERLKQAGADSVQSPYPSYGTSLAASAISSAVLDLHDFPLLGLGTEEIQIPEGSPISGLTPSEILQAHPCVYVLGLRREGLLHAWHTIDGAVQPGDILVALGASEFLAGLADAALGEAPMRL